MTTLPPYVPPVTTVVELLRWRAVRQPDRVGFTSLPTGDPTPTEDHTYAALDRRSRAVAAWLQARGSAGDRVLMLFEEGLAYLDALFGCMYAARLAVPVHPPDPRRLQRTLPRLLGIAENAGVTVVLTTADIADAARPHVKAGTLSTAEWLALDTLDDTGSDAWEDPGVGADDLAYLQYTSGSTALPKGVMVSHRNLLHQLADFDQGYGHSPDSTIVSWLPATHDLGLVYGRLMPLYVGCRCVFLSPATFMQKPSRWPRALSAFEGTHSPSPNFGFEVAARKTTPEEIAALDLSSVQVLLNGAEPIRQESEELFQQRFAPAGLRATAVTHAMGMSESTAKIVTEPVGRHPPKFVHIDGAAYERNEVVLVARGAPGSRSVASNGFTSGDTVVAIVDPSSREVLGEDRVGELWVKGTTIAQGYHANDEATETTFRARTREGDGPYLRTGDLAFLHEGELYLSGRLKDVIIIRGQNHHPQDIEWSVAQAHGALRPNCAAAFGVPGDSFRAADGAGGEGEQLVLVTEIQEDKVGDAEEVFGAIRSAVGEHGLAAKAIVLMPARALPKTSSGKIQRSLARKLFLDGDLPTVHRWDAQAPTAPVAASEGLLAGVLAVPGRRRIALVAEHLQRVAAGLLGLDVADVDADRPFGELGIDSVTAVDMVEQLGRALGLELSGTLLFDHPTIEKLARFVVEDRLGQAEADAVTVLGAERRERPPSGAAVSAMTDAEAEAALLAELEDLEQ
jgi:acyl-CoA synthetase (AMP-forming)/AMP-acid ligase II/acyl carrier protein